MAVPICSYRWFNKEQSDHYLYDDEQMKLHLDTYQRVESAETHEVRKYAYYLTHWMMKDMREFAYHPQFSEILTEFEALRLYLIDYKTLKN
jgi:hypothetical protein